MASKSTIDRDLAKTKRELSGGWKAMMSRKEYKWLKAFHAEMTRKPPPKNSGSNSQKRKREYLTEAEVETLIEASRKMSQNPDRNELLILMMFRHALCVYDLRLMKWDNVDLKYALLHVKRKKGSIDSTHPLSMREIRLLKLLKADPEKGNGTYVFRGASKDKPLSAFMIHPIIAKAGEAAGLTLSVHPHMLRHSTGFYLAGRGMDTKAIQLFMGHRSIVNTAIYTEVNPNSFTNIWKD